MISVKRRPDGFAVTQAVIESAGIGAQVAVAELVLALGQFGNHLIASLLEGVFSRRAVSERAS